MIPKSAITFQVTDHPGDPNVVIATAQETTKADWVVGKITFNPHDIDHLRLSTTRKVWTTLYGDIRAELIEVMNALRQIPDPDYSVITALSKIEELLGKLNLPHTEDLK